MISINLKENCCGCGACDNICPQKCISMKQDKEGFLYPHVDKTKCVSCNLCDKVCPVTNTIMVDLENTQETYLGWANSESVREKATSGGVFSAVAYYMLSNKGYACGAAYDSNLIVKHILVDKVEDVSLLTRSKYVQSQINRIYSDIGELLKQDKTVLFSGTACQVYGLLSYLQLEKISTNKLYTIDIICHGTPSPKLLKEYIKWQEESNGKKVKSVSMREKEHPKPYFSNPYTQIDYSDGTIYRKAAGYDYYGRFFLGEISSRPSCYKCIFKTLGRQSDLTIGDCWFSRSLTGKKEVPFDVTLCLVHSDKGKMLINNSDLTLEKVDEEKAIKCNGGMIYSSPKPHLKREEFFTRLGEEDFGKLAEEYFPIREQKHDCKWMIKQAIKLIPGVYEKYYFEVKKKEFLKRCKRMIPERAKKTILIKP